MLEQHVRHLGGRSSHEADERGFGALDHLLLYRRVVGGEIEKNLDGRHHNRGVAVPQPLVEKIHDFKRLLGALCLEFRNHLEDQALGPLVEVAEPLEQGDDDRLVAQQPHARLALQLKNGLHRVCSHLRVAIVQEVEELVDELAVSDHVRRQLLEAQDAHDRRLPHVPRRVLQPLEDRVDEILEDVFHVQRAQAPQREAPHHRVLVAGVLLERIDDQQRHLGLLRRVVGEIEVAHLLLHQVLCGGGHDHLAEERRHVDAQRHVADDALHHRALVLGVLVHGRVAQQVLELRDLAFLVINKQPAAAARRRRLRRHCAALNLAEMRRPSSSWDNIFPTN